MKKFMVPLDIVGGPPPKPIKDPTSVEETEAKWAEKMYKILREIYHYDEFRGKQKDSILCTPRLDISLQTLGNTS